jgi:hypothetical protein
MPFFLIRYPERPVLVPEQGRVSIGRAESNSIVLTESRVSRLHAMVEFRQASGGYVLQDLSSSNGTVLNGTRIRPTDNYLLSDWDKFRIASAMFTVRVVQSSGEIMQEFTQVSMQVQSGVTEVITPAALKGNPAQAVLSGTLDHLGPIDVFQMLEAARKSGQLVIEAGGISGSFLIRDGSLVQGLFGTAINEQALFSVLGIRVGRFFFTPGEVSLPRGITPISLTALLMEGCRRMDVRQAGTAVS